MSWVAAGWDDDDDDDAHVRVKYMNTTDSL